MCKLMLMLGLLAVVMVVERFVVCLFFSMLVLAAILA